MIKMKKSYSSVEEFLIKRIEDKLKSKGKNKRYMQRIKNEIDKLETCRKAMKFMDLEEVLIKEFDIKIKKQASFSFLPKYTPRNKNHS
jgi:hypothetical protein